MAGEIVGRTDELIRIFGLFDDESSGMRGLVLTGDPGIGKTELVLEAVEHAREQGLRTLVARPAETETGLPYAALADLLGSLPDHVFRGLPAAQGRALAVALMREQPDGPIERTVVARATAATLRSAANEDRLAIVVDDTHWLDPASAQAIAFALRRLVDEAIRVVAACRPESGDQRPLGLDRALRADRLETIYLGPLALEELDAVVRQRLGVRLSKPRISALHETSGGNPLVALEILRAAIDSGELEFRLPPTLSAALEARLAQLSSAGLDAVQVTAAASKPTTSLIARIAGEDGLDEAKAMRILEGDDRLRFSHPTTRSAAYSAMTPRERREVHRRLAEATSDDVERAHHVSRAVDVPSETVASELERAATVALERGAPAIGAQLAEQAARLTPAGSGEDAVRRSLRSAELQQLAGDWIRSREILTTVQPDLVTGSQRARARMLAASVSLAKIGHAAALRELEVALVDAAGDDELVTTIESRITDSFFVLGRPRDALTHARRTAELAARTDDQAMLALALSEEGFARGMLGEGVTEPLRRAIALWGKDVLGVHYPPPLTLGVVRLWLDELAEARRILEAALTDALERGLELPVGTAHIHLAELELRAGRWGRAYDHAEASLRSHERADDDQGLTAALHAQASVEAHLGALEAASTHAADGLARAEAIGDVWWSLQHRGTLGLVCLTSDDNEAAFHHVDPALDAILKMGLGELTVFPVVHIALEAAIGTGRLDRAEQAIELVEKTGELTGRAWNKAIAARGRALAAAAIDDLVTARAQVEVALEAHENVPQPFEHARTLLVHGRIERRSRHRAAARRALTRALELFDELGAARWSEKAADELARVPGRGPAAGDELTETERSVAELVAGGLSNKEVAVRLFVTVRTVEANLTKVYDKLGIRSRTGLANRLHS